MAVNFCHHLGNPFSQGKVKLSAPEKCYASLGLLLLPLMFFPGIVAFFSISYCLKKRAIKKYNNQLPSGNPSFVFSLTKTDSLVKKKKNSNSKTTVVSLNKKTHKSDEPIPKKQKSDETAIGSERGFEGLTSRASPIPIKQIGDDVKSNKSNLEKSDDPDSDSEKPTSKGSPISKKQISENVRSKKSARDQDAPTSLKEAVRLVLTTPGFDTPIGVTANYHNASRKIDSVEEIQGTSDLRKAARHAAKHFPKVLSPRALKENRKANLEQYYIFKVKRISHVFGLTGRVDLPSGRNINLEGFCEDFTVPMISSSFAEFCKINKDNAAYPWLTKDNSNWIQKKLLDLLTTDVIQDKNTDHLTSKLQKENFKGPIAGGSGYDWHSTISGFIGKIAFVCNRGAFSKTSGVALYSLPERTFITKEVLHDLSTRQYHDKHTFFGHKAMEGELGAKQMTIIKMAGQESGNCTYRSVEAYLYTLMAFAHLKSIDPKNFYENLNDSDKLTDSFDAVQPLFDDWLNYDRWLAQNDLMEDIAQMESSGEGDKKEYKLYTKLRDLMVSSKVYGQLKS